MPKSRLSLDTLKMLEALWADGVHSYRSETDKVKVKEVAAATGLVAERVKVWLYNRNRKKRLGSEGPTKREQSTCVLKPRSLSTEGITSSAVGHTTTPGSPAEATSSEAGWEDSNSSVEQQEIEPEQQEIEPQQQEIEPEQQEIEPEHHHHQQHQEKTIELMQAVEDQVHKLHTCNCEVVVMVYNRNSGSLHTTGTDKGLDFLNSQSPAVHWQFSEAMSSCSTETVTVDKLNVHIGS